VEYRFASHESGLSLVPIDSALVGALHVEYLRERDLSEEEHLHHTLFQTSTVDALLEGKYEGDVSFAELGDRGDFGLGTLDALDGEMICLDGSFYQVKADGQAYAIEGSAMTPFAIVTVFEPDTFQTLSMPMDFEAWLPLPLHHRRQKRWWSHAWMQAGSWRALHRPRRGPQARGST
jgi:hypothetical protein